MINSCNEPLALSSGNRLFCSFGVSPLSGVLSGGSAAVANERFSESRWSVSSPCNGLAGDRLVPRRVLF